MECDPTPRGREDRRGRHRLGDLFPPDRYNVHEEYRDVTVNGYPTLQHDTPFYYQFTEDVPLAGIYPYFFTRAGRWRCR
ncbi:MAG TPA: hypothetical protein VN959_01200 [Mycobacterium sp.]|nr:hypothetical protein [Mycobacterium sp.]